MLICYFLWNVPAVLLEFFSCIGHQFFHDDKGCSLCKEFQMWRLLTCEVTLLLISCFFVHIEKYPRFFLKEHFNYPYNSPFFTKVDTNSINFLQTYQKSHTQSILFTKHHLCVQLRQLTLQ